MAKNEIHTIANKNRTMSNYLTSPVTHQGKHCREFKRSSSEMYFGGESEESKLIITTARKIHITSNLLERRKRKNTTLKQMTSVSAAGLLLPSIQCADPVMQTLIMGDSSTDKTS